MMRYGLLLLMLAFATGVLYSQQLPKGVAVYQLDNGMDVLLVKSPQLPMTGVNVVVKTGSAYEHFATSGMSHMLEHLLFNGTSTRNQKQLYDDVDKIGGYNNANTSYYYTNFMMVTPAEHIKRGMEIQADMLFHSTLPLEKFDKEKGIVLEEIARSLNSGDYQQERHTQSILFEGHAASLPTLGTYATIQGMQRDDVYRFYKNAYVPNNMIMSVVGNFEFDSIRTWIDKFYGGVAPGVVVREKPADWQMGLEPVQAHSDGIYHRFFNGETATLDMLYHLPMKLSLPQVDLLQVYFEEITPEIEAKIKQSTSGSIKTIELRLLSSPITDFLKVSIRLESDTFPADLIRKVHNVVQKLSFSLPVEKINTQAIKTRTSFFQNIEKPHMFGIYNAELFAVYGIESVLKSYESKYYHEDAAKLATITLGDQPVTIVHHPFEQQKTSNEADTLITKRSVNDQSGLTVIARQNPASQLLAIHYFIKHKAPLEARFGKNAAWILHDCFAQRLRSPEIQKKSASFGFTFTVNDNPYIPMDNIYLHPDFSYIRAEGLADNYEAAIRFINSLLADFKPTAEEYEKAKANRARIDQRGMPGDRARELFEKTCSDYLYEKNPYAESSTELNFDSVSEFADIFFAPSNVIISIVSPVMADSIITLVTQTYGEEKKSMSPAFEVYSEKLVTQSIAQTKMLDGEGEQSYIFWGFTVPFSPADKAALKALSLVLSDRITFDIREKQGRAYRMSSGIDLIGENALFYVKLGTRPENVEPLQKQMPGFFTQSYLKNLSEEEVTKSINMYLGRMMFRHLSSINQAYYMANSEYFYQDLRHDEQFLGQLAKVTVADVQKAAQKYMIVQNPVNIVVR